MMILHPLKWNRRVRTLKAVEEEEGKIGKIYSHWTDLKSEKILTHPTSFVSRIQRILILLTLLKLKAKNEESSIDVYL